MEWSEAPMEWSEALPARLAEEQVRIRTQGNVLLFVINIQNHDVLSNIEVSDHQGLWTTA